MTIDHTKFQVNITRENDDQFNQIRATIGMRVVVTVPIRGKVEGILEHVDHRGNITIRKSSGRLFHAQRSGIICLEEADDSVKMKDSKLNEVLTRDKDEE